MNLPQARGNQGSVYIQSECFSCWFCLLRPYIFRLAPMSSREKHCMRTANLLGINDLTMPRGMIILAAVLE